MRTALFTLGKHAWASGLSERIGQRVVVIGGEPTTDDEDAYWVRFTDCHETLAFEEELSDWRDEQ